MDRDRLEAELAAGRSIEAIARELGRPPSTVAYWVHKHGLRSRFADKHAPIGGLDRETLVALLERGLSVRAAAAELGVSYATVRHWLRKHGLQTSRGARQAARAASLARDGADGALGECPIHGRTAFVRQASETGFRCLACRKERVTERRRRVKEILVAEAGGVVRPVRILPPSRLPPLPPPRPREQALRAEPQGRDALA